MPPPNFFKSRVSHSSFRAQGCPFQVILVACQSVTAGPKLGPQECDLAGSRACTWTAATRGDFRSPSSLAAALNSALPKTWGFYSLESINSATMASVFK